MCEPNYYQTFHRDRDYRSEVDQVLEVLGPAESIADFGDGCGRHLELIAEAGHRVVEVDALADTGGTVDAAIMMSSLGDQVTNQRILRTLAAPSRRLRPGGLLLFDVIDGEAVLGAPVPLRGLKVLDDPGSRLLCGYTGDVLTEEQVYRLTLRMWRLDGDRVTDRAEETHHIRYFLPRELRLLLSLGGFELVGTAPLAGQRDPATAWLRLGWARKA